jgi:hypothetical protein
MRKHLEIAQSKGDCCHADMKTIALTVTENLELKTLLKIQLKLIKTKCLTRGFC